MPPPLPRGTAGWCLSFTLSSRADRRGRQAQKYALVWKVFFTDASRDQGTDDPTGAAAAPPENVDIDAIVLDDPSWYLVAASETPDPETWLNYAQDRKLEDPRYTVAAFRRDIRRGRRLDERALVDRERGEDDADHRVRWDCPWIRAYCTKSGRPVPVAQCTACDARRCTSPAMGISLREGIAG